jgi:Squalene-hopene cyclase C-terminal domain
VQIDRRTFLLTLVAAASATGVACSRREKGESLRRAAEYLWAQQAEDGGFHSSTYGLLRSGQSLTPFVLDALLQVPESVHRTPTEAISRALKFIREHTDAEGALGRMDETSADYPNYATALAVTVMVKARQSGYERDIATMVTQLRAQQFSEANGWKRDDAAYGAWGMGGPIHRPPEAGHVDLSMTRYVLEALKSAGVPPSDAVMTRALVYLERLQNADGGFYFSTVNPDTNKAGEVDGHFASYGTATADGVLALRASGIPDTNNRIVKAIKWLNDHHRPDRASGFEVVPYESCGTGLRFYYAHVISRTMPELPVQLPPQEKDGSFRNPNNLVKEDDPLIATPFALQVLTRN